MKKRIALKALLLSMACGFMMNTAFAQAEVPPLRGDGVFSIREVDTKPQILYKEKAKYTKEARKNGIQGSVVLSIVFRSDGNISDFRVVRGLPDGLSESSIEAAKKIRFKPAIKNGAPVSVRMAIEYNFNLYYDDLLSYLYYDYGETKETLRRQRWSTSPPHDSYINDTQLMHSIHDGVVSVSIGLAGNDRHCKVILNIKNNSNRTLTFDSRKIHFWLWEENIPNTMPIIITAEGQEKKEYEINGGDIFKKEIELDTKQKFKTLIISVKVNGTYYEFPFDK